MSKIRLLFTLTSFAAIASAKPTQFVIHTTGVGISREYRDAIAALEEKYAGTGKLKVYRDTGNSTFTRVQVIEADPSLVSELKSKLSQLPTETFNSVDELVKAAKSPAAPALSQAELAAFTERLKTTDLVQRTRHARELTNALSKADPAAIAKISPEVRNAAAAALFEARDLVEGTFNRLMEDSDQRIRSKIYDDRLAAAGGNRAKADIGNLYSDSIQAFRRSSDNAKLKPYRNYILGLTQGLDKLGTAAGTSYAAMLAPSADYSGLPAVTGTPESQRKFAAQWIKQLHTGINDTVKYAGPTPEQRDELWREVSLEYRSGDRELLGAKRRNHPSYPFGTGEMPDTMHALLGMPNGAAKEDIKKAVVMLALGSEPKIAKIDAAHKKQFMENEMRSVREMARSSGMPLESQESMLQSYARQLEQRYRPITGHYGLDEFLRRSMYGEELRRIAGFNEIEHYKALMDIYGTLLKEARTETLHARMTELSEELLEHLSYQPKVSAQLTQKMESLRALAETPWTAKASMNLNDCGLSAILI